MKPIGKAIEQAEKKLRYRQYHWCRRPNGFSDMPVWRVVAQYAGLPLVAVLAVVNRLEELANNAANFGEERGSVASFDADEFGAALGLASEEVARIFAALEHERVRWVEEGCVRTFHDRNPDREEDKQDVRDRQRRSRSRKRIRECLARLAAMGKLDERERTSIEVTLKGLPDGELVELQVRLAKREREPVTLSQSDRCDNVTVTPEKTKPSDQDQNPVTQLGATAVPVDPAVFAETAKALQWLKGDGEALVTHRLGGLRSSAGKAIERWQVTMCHNAPALAQTIYRSLATQAKGEAFRTLIENQVARRAAEMIAPALPLPPMALKRRGDG
ncbi:hypothetical protein ACVWW6_006055 [Bradyrhizobium sp. USDA 3311]